MFGSGQGFRLFSFKGIPVELDIFAIFLIAIYALQIGSSENSAVVGIGVSVGIFVSILIHEFAHALLGTRLGARVTGIRLHILGGATFFAYKPASYFKDMLISISGPLSNFVLWKLCEFGYTSLLHSRDSQLQNYDIISIFYYLSQANLLLGIFNSIPGFPLDGGQALYSFLMWTTKRAKLAATVIMVLGCLAAAGVLYFFTGGFNFRGGLSINLLFALYIAYWIASSSIALYKQTASPVKPQPTPRQQAEDLQRQSEERAKSHPGQRFFDQGRAFLLDKDYSQAINSFNSAIEIEPREMSYLDYRAYTYALLQDYTRALDDYNLLIEKIPNRADFYTARAQVYKNIGKVEAARADLEKALELNPTEGLALQLKQELTASS